MDIPAYEKYLKNVLKVTYESDKKYKKYRQVDASDATFLEKYRIKKSQIKFIDGIDYMKSLKNADVRSEDFRDIIKENSDGFIYLDSPYFLTTDYEVPFRDEEHMQMLDILRNSEFNWLFSMQYYGLYAGDIDISDCKRNGNDNQDNGNLLIRNYEHYYHGFVRPFERRGKEGKQYYQVDTSGDSQVENKIWLLLFYPKKTAFTVEMMLCKFDPRRSIPYAFEYDKELGHHIEIMPYPVFLDNLVRTDGNETPYEQLREIAHNWRKNNIIGNYASGARV